MKRQVQSATGILFTAPTCSTLLEFLHITIFISDILSLLCYSYHSHVSICPCYLYLKYFKHYRIMLIGKSYSAIFIAGLII